MYFHVFDEKSTRKANGAQASQTLLECVRGLTLLTTAARSDGVASAAAAIGGLL